MCEFCVQHGDGQKWYLAMHNYSRELLEQDDRLAYAAHFLNTFTDRLPGSLSKMAWLASTPLHGPARPILEWRQKATHYGQVVPLEEVEQVLRQVDGIARLPCVCRRVTAGQQEARFCFALTGHPQLAGMLDDSFSLEYLSASEAIEAVRRLDCDGLIHTLWTFKTPFIGGLCNCDRDCLAFRTTHSADYFRTMFRGESVAHVLPEACNGCRNCLRHWQFGAMRYSAAERKVSIDARACYGCGVCRSACHRDAIGLHARAQDPVAARLW